MLRLSVLFLLLCSFVLTGCSGPPEEKKDVTKAAPGRMKQMKDVTDKE